MANLCVMFPEWKYGLYMFRLQSFIYSVWMNVRSLKWGEIVPTGVVGELLAYRSNLNFSAWPDLNQPFSPPHLHPPNSLNSAQHAIYLQTGPSLNTFLHVSTLLFYLIFTFRPESDIKSSPKTSWSPKWEVASCLVPSKHLVPTLLRHMH